MSIPESLKAAQGTWSGESRLHLHEEPIRTSPSRASVALVAGGKYLSLSYDWVYEGASQEGLILLGLENEAGSTARGTYQVEGYPDWGWRIDVANDAALRVVMYNVSPEGEEYLGFELIYHER